MFQILLLKNPLFKKGLKPIQKLAYLSSMTFWFFPLPRMVFTFAPLLHIFFDVKIFVSSMDEALAYTATYMVVNLMLQNYLYGRVRWPFVSELYEYVQGVYLAKAIVSVVMKPRKPTFNVTAKGLSLDENHLSSLAWPFFAIFGLLLVGAATAFYRYFTQPGADLMLIVGLWTTFNLVIAGVGLGVVAERREPDRFPRLGIDRRGILSIGGLSHPVTIDSVSAGGCSIRFGAHDAIPSGLLAEARCSLAILPLNGGAPHDPLVLDLIHATPGADKTTIGFSFSGMKPASYMALADLMYGDPDAILRFLKGRRAHKNLLKGSWQFLRWGVLEPVRAFTYLTARKATPIAEIRSVAPPAEAPSDVLEAVALPLLVAGIDVSPVTAEAAFAIERSTVTSDLVIPDTAILDAEIVTLDLADAAPPEDSFDALVEALFDAEPKEAVIDFTADWMHELLTLASTEMTRESTTGEQAFALSSVAA